MPSSKTVQIFKQGYEKKTKKKDEVFLFCVLPTATIFSWLEGFVLTHGCW